MSSGYGLHSAGGRCYPRWIDFIECEENCRHPDECLNMRDRYMQCKAPKQLTLFNRIGRLIYGFNDEYHDRYRKVGEVGEYKEVGHPDFEKDESKPPEKYPGKNHSRRI